MKKITKKKTSLTEIYSDGDVFLYDSESYRYNAPLLKIKKPSPEGKDCNSILLFYFV